MNIINQSNHSHKVLLTFIRYKKKKEGSDFDHYTFYCAQYEKEITKKHLTDNVNKQRARLTMDRFDCEGYLHVSIPQESAEEVRIKLTHCEAHIHYVNIEIDGALKMRIEELKDLPPYTVSTILIQGIERDTKHILDLGQNPYRVSWHRSHIKADSCTMDTLT